MTMSNFLGPESGRDRRAHRRVPVSTRARLEMADHAYMGWCQNISTGGLGLSAESPGPEVGSIVNVEVELPDAGQLTSPAEVVRRSGGELGLRFLRLDQASLLALLAYTTR